MRFKVLHPFKTFFKIASSLALCLSLSSCLDAFSYDKCIAQTGSLPNGKGGGSQFPGKMSREACEAKCEPIRQAAIAASVWGYCRLGNDYLWRLNEDTELEERLEAFEEAQSRYEEATMGRICRVELFNAEFVNEGFKEWQNIYSEHRCSRKCKPLMRKAQAQGGSAECYLDDELLLQVGSNDSAYGDEYFE